MRVHAIALTALVLAVATGAPMWRSEAAAEQPEQAFVDLYGGFLHLFESDVPDWKLKDDTPVVGGRVGVWIGRNWGLTFRTWYFQTDAKLDNASPSDLAFLGLSLELIGRWYLAQHWALYGTLGPMVAVTSLDRQRDSVTGIEDDSRSVAPGGSLDRNGDSPFQAAASLRGSSGEPCLSRIRVFRTEDFSPPAYGSRFDGTPAGVLMRAGPAISASPSR